MKSVFTSFTHPFLISDSPMYLLHNSLKFITSFLIIINTHPAEFIECFRTYMYLELTTCGWYSPRWDWFTLSHQPQNAYSSSSVVGPWISPIHIGMLTGDTVMPALLCQWLFLRFIYTCMNVLRACMSVSHLCEVSSEAGRGFQIPWNFSYKWFWATMSLLGAKPRSSGKMLLICHGFIFPSG